MTNIRDNKIDIKNHGLQVLVFLDVPLVLDLVQEHL